MSFVDGNNSGFYMPVAPAYNGGYGGGMGNCWGDNSMWWFITCKKCKSCSISHRIKDGENYELQRNY